MADSMQHRGPDGSGEWTAPGVGLAHLRLSIIDIAGSPQPMASDDEAVTLTYNGEIYNFRELRAELEDRGHRFRTSGDTEVIIAAMEFGTYLGEEGLWNKYLFLPLIISIEQGINSIIELAFC